MNEVVFGTVFGVLLGPHVLDIFDPRSWTGITDILTREITRIVLVTGLFTIGVHLPNKYMADHAKSLLIMVVPTMAFGWLVSAGKRAGVTTSRCLTLLDSLHPCPFPPIGLRFIARHFCLLDPYRSHRQCCCHRSAGTRCSYVNLDRSQVP